MATERSKHLDMPYRYTRERIAVHMDAALRCNESAEYLGDMNTEALPRSVSEHWATLGLVDAEYEDPKALPRAAFEKHRARLGLVDAEDPRVRRIIASARDIESKHRAAHTGEALEAYYARYFDAEVGVA